MMTGYLHSNYAESFMKFGVPIQLPRCGGWIIKRRIPGFPYYDAMGCYPLFACRKWSELYADLEDLGKDLISLSLVTDPFGDFNEFYLHKCFRDLLIPFKEHFVIDLHRPMDSFVSKHHRRYSKKALQSISVERCSEPIHFLNEWINLYAILIKRHNINGIASFSKDIFIRQFSVPGIVVFHAVHKDKTIGMLLWYIHGEVGYYHLGAYNDTGYKMRASFALFAFAIKYFAAVGLRWLNLGAGAGIHGDGKDGLSQFKRGWSTGTSRVFFCGRIFDAVKYANILKAKGVSQGDYFPAYRQGEF